MLRRMLKRWQRTTVIVRLRALAATGALIFVVGVATFSWQAGLMLLGATMVGIAMLAANVMDE